MNKRIYLLIMTFLFLLTQGSMAVTVEQVTETVTITDPVDYIISSETPFGDNGVVDIVNTEKAVVILSNVKPSAALKLLAKHVKINGAKPTNGANCQVKLYNRGCIILPYNNKNALTVYSEPNYGGTAVSSFGTENDGGFMNTLTEAKLNNQIQSFKLKRGYMVTFSTLPKGRGYSRCFIAADKDLEIAKLPAVLNNKISSYRLFKWYDTGKACLANDTRSEAISALNVTSCYSFGLGENRSPDAECVPHHIHEGWPSIADCGKVTYSPHLKTNNEPRNPSDDSPATLADILKNWEDLMATGMRLCSPSSWDGSDYWNGTGFLKEFFDSIDARGWRCDIIDLHGYWTEGSFRQNIPNWYKAVKRPIWVSEWCWGASWNKNGAFANGVTQQQVKAAMQTICQIMNGQAYVERYYFWNSEADISKVYKDGKLTPAGEYYATIKNGPGYKSNYDYVPTTPKQYAPSNFSVSIANGKATINWNDKNGEYNQLMEVQRRGRDSDWITLAIIDQKETAASYSYEDEVTEAGLVYRVHIKDVSGKDYYSQVDGDTTGIDEVESQNTSDDTKHYRLDGRPTRQPRGLYIEQKNGQTRKKIMN
jgi:hypothetical protein